MGCLTAKASGSIANFISPTVTPIESAKVYFSPTQLGEGTPSPENVREIVGRTNVELKQCGKNLWKYGDLINRQNNQDYDFTYILMPNQEYTFSAIVESTSPYDTCLIRLEGDGLQEKRIQKSTNGKRTFVTFNSGSKNYNRIRLYAFIAYSQDYYATYKDIQLELGSTATPYEPYQGTTIPFSWKRLPDEYQEVEWIKSDGNQYIDTGIIFNHGIKITAQMGFVEKSNSKTLFGVRLDTNTTRFLVTYYNGLDFAYWYDIMPFQPDIDTIYNIVFDTTQPQKFIYGVDESSWQRNITELTSDITGYIFAYHRKSDNSVQGMSRSYFKSMTIENSNGKYIFNGIPCYRKSDNEIGIYDIVSQTFLTNLGTGTFTKGEDVTSDVFSDEVYGGYVDLVKGEIVETYGKFVFTGDENIRWHGWGNDFYIHEHTTDKNKTIPFVATDYTFCNMETPIKSRLVNIPSGNISIVGNDTIPSYTYLVCSSDGYGNSLEECKAKLKELYDNGTPLTVVTPYKTAFIKTHPLPDYLKTQLQTLKNENTFWSDADSVEIDYDLAETFDIQKAKRKIIMNQPHIETASNSLSSPQVIKFKTDMRAPLKECIVNFAPIQEGSGDPSPTNIRPIKGWNGITLNHTGINMLQCSSPSYYMDATNNGITSQSSRNADNEIIGIDFNGTTTSTNIFRNLNYNPNNSGAVTMPRGLMGLTGYSDQVYVIPMGISDVPRTTDGRYWTKANTNSENGWNVWSVDSSETYNGLWVRTQVFPRETNINVDTTVYPMMCLAEDVGCEFEPYKGENFDIDWTNDAGTVYGGYVDLVSGELVAEYFGFVADGVNVAVNHGYVKDTCYGGGLVYFSSRYSFPDGSRILSDWYCDKLKPVLGGSGVGVLTYPWAGDLYCVFYPFSKTSEEIKTNAEAITETNAWLQDNPVTVVYKLATPITYQLTPQQILSLKGQNNLWANTNGTIDVKYWKH